MKKIAILGSTGSIGRSCLSVVAADPERFKIVSMTGGENAELMAEQVVAAKPLFVSLASEQAAIKLRKILQDLGNVQLPEISFGADAMKIAATIPDADIVLSSTVGVAGLPATYDAVLAGKQVALANKEVLVAAGELVTRAAQEHGMELLPVDSEHNAVHQCLRAGERGEASRLILTASGGPFLRTPLEEIESATVEQALNHPTWKMGSRITIDSATMMNKGFEVIEACWLFGFAGKDVMVKVHPQSTVHSMVEFVDGSILAQISVTDMRLPILYALTYPERLKTNNHLFDWSTLTNLEFREPSFDRFPCLRLAYEAMDSGASYPCALNAADEVAVAAFLEGKIPFGAISRLVADVLHNVPRKTFNDMGDVLEHDEICRARARELLVRHLN